MDEGLCVSVGDKMKNTILTANQGGRSGFSWSADSDKPNVIAMANEEPEGSIGEEERYAYRLTFGRTNDSLYAEGLFGREKPPDYSFRWSTEHSALRLPIPKNQDVDIEFQANIPEAAISGAVGNAGIYLGDEKLAASTEPGLGTCTVHVPPQESDRVKLDVRVNGWQASKGDDRLLGIQYLSVKVTASGRTENRVFDVNNQEWIGE